jgi:hypothetical protein
MGYFDKEFSKRKLLIIGLFFDLIGMISYVFPPIDIVWAPLSAFLMTKLHKGNLGKIGGIFSFIEEILPFDFVPSFTIVWLYKYYVKKED